MAKPFLYIAGPYSKPCPVFNTRAAMRVWDRLWDTGLFVPICPHWTMIQQLHSPREYEVWMEYDFAIIERCDAVLRIPGESAGADREVDYAEILRKPVFYSEQEAVSWAKGGGDGPTGTGAADRL